jgi:hypothetical protein
VSSFLAERIRTESDSVRDPAARGRGDPDPGYVHPTFRIIAIVRSWTPAGGGALSWTETTEVCHKALSRCVWSRIDARPFPSCRETFGTYVHRCFPVREEQFSVPSNKL